MLPAQGFIVALLLRLFLRGPHLQIHNHGDEEHRRVDEKCERVLLNAVHEALLASVVKGGDCKVVLARFRVHPDCEIEKIE